MGGEVHEERNLSSGEKKGKKGEEAVLIICTRRFLFCNYKLESRTSTQAIGF